MPKKAKKGKGKGKGKKGKKKGAKKAENKLLIAKANAKLWETRLSLIETSRDDFRTAAKRLIYDNDELQRQVQQTEKDTIDVVTFLKRKDQDKDDQIQGLQQGVKDQKKDHRKEKDAIVEDFQRQVNELETRMADRGREVEVLKSELKAVNEFRKKRNQMQRDLDEIKDSMFVANKEHKERLGRMEQKFFDEKMRLQQEASQKIAKLAERAHTEAISNLDETTRSIYKENVRLSEALGYHMREEDKLRKECARLKEENDGLEGEKELNEAVVKDKVAEAKRQREQIKELQEKVDLLETALSHSMREFRDEKGALGQKARMEQESATTEIDKLKRMLELKGKEILKVKKLAKNILDQRTEVEQFFLESLDDVKREIIQHQAKYRKDALQAYQKKMSAANRGGAEYPRVRTFTKSDTSTNTVYRDMEAAEILFEVQGEVDIAELTWEQKERVLRFLFAKMNGHVRRKAGAALASLPPIDQGGMVSRHPTAGDMANPQDSTFLTQASIDARGLLPPVGEQFALVPAPPTQTRPLPLAV